MENVNRMKNLRRGKGSLTRERMSISGTRNNKMKREEKRGEREENEKEERKRREREERRKRRERGRCESGGGSCIRHVRKAEKDSTVQYSTVQYSKVN